MIKLTGISGDELYLNPDKIIGVYPGEGYASIHADGESAYGVKESPEEVVEKILDYKFSTEEYRMRLANGDMYLAQGRADELLKLAGLTLDWKINLDESIKGLIEDIKDEG